MAFRGFWIPGRARNDDLTVLAMPFEYQLCHQFNSVGLLVPLFRKLWLRQLKAASTEAMAETDRTTDVQPMLAEVAAFLDGVRAAEPFDKSMPGRMSLEMRETDKALYTEIRRRNGRWVHRSFVAYQ